MGCARSKLRFNEGPGEYAERGNWATLGDSVKLAPRIVKALIGLVCVLSLSCGKSSWESDPSLQSDGNIASESTGGYAPPAGNGRWDLQEVTDVEQAVGEWAGALELIGRRWIHVVPKLDVEGQSRGPVEDLRRLNWSLTDMLTELQSRGIELSEGLAEYIWNGGASRMRHLTQSRYELLRSPLGETLVLDAGGDAFPSTARVEVLEIYCVDRNEVLVGARVSIPVIVRDYVLRYSRANEAEHWQLSFCQVGEA